MSDPDTGPHPPAEGETDCTTGGSDGTEHRTSELPESNRVGRILLGCAGANPEHLHERAELRWYHSLGASVVFTALVAAASLYVLMVVCFDLPWQVMTAISAVWACVVFNIDRLIVARVLSKPRLWNKAGLFLTRLILVVAVALMMAVGVEVLAFSPEIDQKIAELNVESQTQREGEARDKAKIEFRTELGAPGAQAFILLQARNAATTAREAADLREACESEPNRPGLVCTDSGTGVPGDGDRTAAASRAVDDAVAKEKAASEAYTNYAIAPRPTTLTGPALAICGLPVEALITQQREQECVATQLVEGRVQQVVATGDAQNDRGLIRRLVALAALAAAQHGFWVTALRVLIFVAVGSIDLVPLSAKLFGGATGHDMRARRDYILASNDYMIESNNSIRKEPHFLDKTGPMHQLLLSIGFAPDYEEEAKTARSKHYSALFEHQSTVLKQNWQPHSPDRPGDVSPGPPHDGSSPPPRTSAAGRPWAPRNSQDDERAQTPSDSDTEKLPLTDPGDPTEQDPTPKTMKKTSAAFVGDGLFAGKILKAKNGHEYRLIDFMKAKANNVNQLWKCTRNDIDDGLLYVAKCCTREGFKALHRDLASSQVDSVRVIEPASGISVSQDKESGFYFIVLPYYQDGDLSAFQQSFHADPSRGIPARRVPLATALRITQQLLEGLGDVHERGIVHCDIKPRNILLDLSNGNANPEVIITDFGSMKLMTDHLRAEVTQVFVGTEPYAPPEQLLTNADVYGRRANATDLWAVGAVLFRMLTNEAPRDRLVGKPTWSQKSDEYKDWLRDAPEVPRLDVIDPSIPARIADVVATWLSKDPWARVSAGVNIEVQNSRAVMDDALNRLDEAMVTL